MDCAFDARSVNFIVYRSTHLVENVCSANCSNKKPESFDKLHPFSFSALVFAIKFEIRFSKHIKIE